MNETRSKLDDALLARLERLRLLARERAPGDRAGARRSLRHGSGLEPAGHRAYAPGDDFRRVDWNVFRRLGQLHVTEREHESERTVSLLLDRSASMGRGGKLELGRAVVGALAYLALSEGDRVEAATFAAGKLARGRPCRGTSSVLSLLRFLDENQASGTTNVAEACRALARSPRRPGLAVLVTDFLDEGPAKAALAALAERRDSVVLHLISKEDEDPGLRGLREVVDCETGEALTVACDAQGLRDYAHAFAEWTRELEALARSLGAVYVRARSDEPLESIVIGLLRRSSGRGMRRS